MSQHTGILICIEGIDGSGKSTLARQLVEKFEQDGYDVLLTKEPGGSPLGKELRSLLQHQPVPITPLAEYLLFAADRAQHIEQVVKPALQKGVIVISDRMADSSLVYQGYGRGIDKNMIQQINAWAMQYIHPSLTLYVSISASVAALRLDARKQRTSFEKEDSSFVQKLIDGFDTLYANRADVIICDGTLSVENLTHQTYQKVFQWMNKNL